MKMGEQEREDYEELLNKISMLDNLYNNDFVTYIEYWTIKNRILDRIVMIRKYHQTKKDINAK